MEIYSVILSAERDGLGPLPLWLFTGSEKDCEYYRDRLISNLSCVIPSLRKVFETSPSEEVKYVQTSEIDGVTIVSILDIKIIKREDWA